MRHDLSSPQQYGVWRVEGIGLVVAFRGTASSEDCLIDATIHPVPLEHSGEPAGVCTTILLKCTCSYD